MGLEEVHTILQLQGEDDMFWGVYHDQVETVRVIYAMCAQFIDKVYDKLNRNPTFDEYVAARAVFVHAHLNGKELTDAEKENCVVRAASTCCKEAANIG